MAVYLSPGVFPREIDLSALPTAVGPLRPAFIGTANKGPMNQAIFISNSQQFIETFGTPFPESYLGYAVLAYMEEGNQCYCMRVGIECHLGQPDAITEICVDTTGSRIQGWGRIPLFAGIDYGRVNLRAMSDTNPITFHAASIPADNIEYNDVETGTMPAAAELTASGTYTGAVDDSFVMIITGAPADEAISPLAGCTFQIVRNSDGEIVAIGTLTDAGGGASQSIAVAHGISITVQVTDGALGVNDTFVFDVVPDNTTFTVDVEDEDGNIPDPVPVIISYTTPMTTVAQVVDKLNEARNAAPGGSNQDYVFVAVTLEDGTQVPSIRTMAPGRRIQITGTKGWALEVGTAQYAWDIPRSYLMGLDGGPYTITSQNNRVAMDIIGDKTTVSAVFNLPVGVNQTPDSIAHSISAAGIQNGQQLFNAFAMKVPNGTTHVVITTSLVITVADHSLDTLYIKANFSNLKTLRFAEELAFQYPYQKSYRGFVDYRVSLPPSSEQDAAIPLNCDAPDSDECVADTAYFKGIVGWLVAPSPGTWLTGHHVALDIATGVVGDASGRYNLSIKDPNNQVLDIVQDVNFDRSSPKYIGNYLNPGSTFGGVNGNSFYNWEERPGYLQFDPNSADYMVRNPSPFANRSFEGMANGIPLDPAYSSELDAAVIGNPAEASGIYAFQNPETIDINLLSIPGFSSGAVIGQGLAMCEGRGDVLYLVDPPFGLRPQQAIDWHNGMLLSDLRAAINSSYGALYWGWLQSYDQFAGNTIWVPPSGHIAAVFSRTSRVAEQWFAPAGLNRGHILTALDVEYSPTQGERDLLYGSGNAVNAIVKFPKDGITVWGQRTLQRTQSALDRVSVRMLLIYIKKNLTQVLRSFVFEPNDQILWAQVKAVVEPFLADITARRGLTGFNVVVDATNNTPERIDRNELWVSVFLKPTRAVEFIVLNLVIMRTGASFTAEEILAAGGVVAA